MALKKIITIIISIPLYLFSKNFIRLIIFFKFFYKPKKSNYLSWRTILIFLNSLYLLSIIKLFKFIRKDVLIIDQGFFQILWSILYELNFSESLSYDFLLEKWFNILNSLEINTN